MVNSLEQLEALMSETGQELLARIAAHDPRPDELLNLGTKLRRDYAPEIVAAALTLHELRGRAQQKFSRAGEMYFTRAGYEQSSSEMAARHRAQRYRGFNRIADLCTGIGGDLIAMADVAPVLAVDRDPLHLKIACTNAEVYGVGAAVTGLMADVQEVDLTGIDAVYIDPARREGDRRLGSSLTEPPLDWCFGLAERVSAVGIKAAPGIDHDLVPAGWEIEFVADGRDLKESVLWSPPLATTPRRATLLPGGETLVAVPGENVEIRDPGAFLLDPNPAITRAGLVEDLARTIDAWKIDEQIAFLSTDRAVSTPFARTLRIAASLPWNVKQISARLRELDVGAVDIRRRGLAGDVEELRKRFKLKGTKRATVAMTRVRDAPWCFICFDIDEPN
jgi:hypothetical protein